MNYFTLLTGLLLICKCYTYVESCNYCQNGGTCLKTHNWYTCTCKAGFSGHTCEYGCDSSTCKNGGSCRKLNTGYECDCTGTDYGGHHCEQVAPVAGYSRVVMDKDCYSNDITNGPIASVEACAQTCDALPNCVGFVYRPDNSYCWRKHKCVSATPLPGHHQYHKDIFCPQNPCLHNGRCSELINGYTCQCTNGYTGKDCQININDCAPGLCFHNGTCTDLIGGYVCQCSNGFTGKNCETDIDDCAPGLCFHNGTCTDLIGGYVCQCSNGFTGKNCETDIDDCAPGLCFHNGTCTDLIGGYVCQCSNGFTGKNCETDSTLSSSTAKSTMDANEESTLVSTEGPSLSHSKGSNVHQTWDNDQLSVSSNFVLDESEAPLTERKMVSVKLQQGSRVECAKECMRMGGTSFTVDLSLGTCLVYSDEGGVFDRY